MKKFLLCIFSLILLSLPVVAITNDDVVLFEESNLWGLQNQEGEVLISPTYKKMIRVGYHSWLVQGKNNRFGLTDEAGKVIVEPKYRHGERILGKYAKFGNSNDFGLYNELGELLIPHNYSKIDLLYGQMFLTYKNYKYGIIGFNGKIILNNEYDDIFMPSKDVMRILYKGEWYEVSGLNTNTLTLPENARNHIYDYEGIDLYKIVRETSVVSGYSALTLADYLIKIFSSVSPAHEETIDELMLSYGADTVTILKKLTWLPKYPVTYVQKYFQIMRNPNSGPLTDFKNTLRRKIN